MRQGDRPLVSFYQEIQDQKGNAALERVRQNNS